MIVFEGPPGGVTGGFVLPEAVAEHGAHDVREVDHHAQAAVGRLLRGRLDQLGCLSLLAAPGPEHHRGVCDGRRPGHLRDRAVFFDERGRGAQLTPEDVHFGEEVDREPQLHERSGVTGDLNLADGQGLPGLEVPQFHGDDGACSPAGDPEPARVSPEPLSRARKSSRARDRPEAAAA